MQGPLKEMGLTRNLSPCGITKVAEGTLQAAFHAAENACSFELA